MTRQEFENIIVDAMNMARRQVWFPKDTGNMAFASFKGHWLGEDKFRLYFDETVAPYVYYTNETWHNRKGTNPNEKWIENKLIPFLVNYIARRLKGRTKRK
jgi:hypothetical protein